MSFNKKKKKKGKERGEEEKDRFDNIWLHLLFIVVLSDNTTHQGHVRCCTFMSSGETCLPR